MRYTWQVKYAASVTKIYEIYKNCIFLFFIEIIVEMCSAYCNNNNNNNNNNNIPMRRIISKWLKLGSVGEFCRDA